MASNLHFTKLTRWYCNMAQSWLTVEPILRRRLILRSHQWLAESVFTPQGIRPEAVEELGPGGPLASAFAEMIPKAERAIWRPWVRLVLQDLRRALRWPRSRQTEAWYRWLFLIPYSVPMPPRRPAARAVSRAARASARRARSVPGDLRARRRAASVARARSTG